MSEASPPAARDVILMVCRLGQFLRQVQTYGGRHPAADAACDEVIASMDGLLQGLETCTVRFVMPHVTFNDQTLRPAGDNRVAVNDLSGFLAARGIGGLHIEGTPDERAFYQFAIEVGGDVDGGIEAVNEALERGGVTSLRALPIRSESDDALGGAGDTSVGLMRLYLRAARAVDQSQRLGLSPALALEFEEIAVEIVEQTAASPRRMLALTALDGMLEITSWRPFQLAAYGALVGRHLDIEHSLLVELALCALLVDVGMRQVALDRNDVEAAERALACHPVHTVQELLRLPRLDARLCRQLMVAFEHHLGCDGEGYPEVVRWPQLHPFSRIISCADHLAELRAQSGKTPDVSALSESLRAESGASLDPLVVEYVVTAFGEQAFREEASHG